MMNILKQVSFLPVWILFRLPWAFSISFFFMTLFWIFYGFRWTRDLLALFFPTGSTNPLLNNFNEFLLANFLMLILVLGFIVAYNLSVLLNGILIWLKWKPQHYPSGIPSTMNVPVTTSKEFDHVKRIGIVLAGGGAKGAFQAGSMKAIYRFLEKRGALEKVKVIAATSIGSWNALFWLARFIQPYPEWQGKSIHERWWGLINAKSLTAPSWYIPFFRNAFLSSIPWQNVFESLFCKDQKISDTIRASEIKFFFTRSNVRTGELECATNEAAPVPISGIKYDILDPAGESTKFMEELKAAVFTSMDLPPLFPYFKRKGQYFEDGGVIDNLPSVIAAVHHCDLLFVLPLNSDFEEEPNLTSVLARIFRVMDVRQGILERNGFKMIYLYDELAELRKDAQESRRQLGLPASLPGESPLARALQRTHEKINVFAICPQKIFVKKTIDTYEFWKSKEAARAFNAMYNATEKELLNFRFDRQKDRVCVALVSEEGKILWDDDF
ncbi:MAG: patatin-like phospholipase family protein [Nitrospirae bacterium]|nr:patatin-like phospholipase family protein [Nitrospirota bacterium]